MNSKNKNLIILVFLCAVLIETTIILYFNSGHLTYTLDDPYIHMALAENIINGHYGINPQDVSAPSSSILWSFILAPFSKLSFFIYIPLIINIIAATLTIVIFGKIFEISFDLEKNQTNPRLINLFLILLIPSVNLIGLIFSGMEHSLQVLLASLIVYGLIKEAETEKLNKFLIFAIIAAPLIRFENLAISLPAVVYLFFRKDNMHKFKYRKSAVICLILIVVMFGAYSLFLLNLGFKPLPTSVYSKSSVVNSSSVLFSLIANMQDSLTNSRGILLTIGFLGLISFSLFSKADNKKKLLAVCVSLSVLLHLLAGRYGWYHRYEIYIWTALLLTSFHIFNSKINDIAKNHKFSKITLIVLISFTLLAAPYFYAHFTLPLAANNIYEQQYQMHRFAAEFYQEPVAVNDVGYIAYRNDNYVQDLSGVASIKAMKNHGKTKDSAWLSELMEKNNVKLAMIYDDYYEVRPESWIKIGELHLSKTRITPARSNVSFYAVDSASYEKIHRQIKKFRETLPENVMFTYND